MPNAVNHSAQRAPPSASAPPIHSGADRMLHVRICWKLRLNRPAGVTATTKPLRPICSSAVAGGEQHGVIAEALGDGHRHQQAGQHHEHEHQPHRRHLGVEPVGHPRRVVPGPVDGDEQEGGLGGTRPREVGEQVMRQLRDGEDVDKVEEQLEVRRPSLALRPAQEADVGDDRRCGPRHRLPSAEYGARFGQRTARGAIWAEIAPHATQIRPDVYFDSEVARPRAIATRWGTEPELRRPRPVACRRGWLRGRSRGCPSRSRCRGVGSHRHASPEPDERRFGDVDLLAREVTRGLRCRRRCQMRWDCWRRCRRRATGMPRDMVPVRDRAG